jgi:hypothetical protein
LLSDIAAQPVTTFQPSCSLLDGTWATITPAAACEKVNAYPSLVARRTVANLYPLDLRRIDFVCLSGDSEETIDLLSDAYKNGTDYYDIQIQGRSIGLWNGVCDCPTGIAYTNVSGTVVGCKTTEKKLFVTLTPVPQTPPDPRPKGTEGKDPKSSTLELIAKVMEGSAPKAGVAVTFVVTAEFASGGHASHSGTRPTGTVPASGVTDANGEFKFKFKSGEFAGIETITATCDSCSNKTATSPVKVKVADLVELTADTAKPARYKLIGSTGKHAANHYFTEEAREALQDMLDTFTQFNWGTVGVNDASLVWGGRFDIAGAWGGSHHEHRDGQEVDISFYNPGGIPPATRQKVYDQLRTAEEVDTPEVLWHLKDNSGTGSKAHFHVYLLGQKPSRTTPF